MKKLTVFILFLGIASTAAGAVSTRVRFADSNIPLLPVDANLPHIIYPDIMVGTELTIVVYSDVAEYWGKGKDNGGSLALEEEYWDYGVLSGRGPKVGADWSGSHLPAAGNEAVVWDWVAPGIDGFDLYTGSTGIETGDWFIIDYNALEIGDCNVGFYEHEISWDDPIYWLDFSHVLRTRDFNNDTIVNFFDFAVLASYWRAADCIGPNWCEGADLDIDGDVDPNDLMLFVDSWLERTK